MINFKKIFRRRKKPQDVIETPELKKIDDLLAALLESYMAGQLSFSLYHAKCISANKMREREIAKQ